ncbi:methyl-accepting chemotaxis protein [Paenibacillus alba]|uniref:Methyl-accepting chemotaxis protein n=1 Tax=Paenibacillus alba TaxID=1197127 RepID=A0ABU6GC68_9BACL|nr:methyl-accepting chemotaxis protein [Paenibacillus alba]MEC0231787.1 methyl-accepting chemotaxis protein [Paenibacillus alba]
MNLIIQWTRIANRVLQRWILRSVGVKLFIMFFLCITLFVSLAGYATYSVARQMIENQVAAASHQMIIQAHEKLDMLYERYETFSFQFAVDNNLQSAIRSYRDGAPGSPDRQLQWDKMKTQFEDILFRDSTLNAVSLYEPDGKEITIVGANNRSQQQGHTQVADQSWFHELKDKKMSMTWVQPKDTNKEASAFGLARILQDPLTKQTIAYLMIEIKTDVLLQQLKSIHLGEAGINRIVNSQLETVLAAGANDDQSSLLAIPSDPSTDKKMKTGSIISRTGQGKGQLMVFDQATDDRLGWYVVSTISLSELLSEANRIFNVTVIIGLIAAIAAGGLGAYVVRFIGRPLHILKTGMQKGSEGDLSTRVDFQRTDEIGVLGSSFNLMMQHIQKLVEEANQSAQDVLHLADEVLGGAQQTTESAQNNALSTSQIAGATHVLSQEADQASRMTQTVLEQMKQVVSVNRQMDESATIVRNASEEGKRFMEEVVSNNHQVEAMTLSMQDRVKRLAESTQAVTKIVQMLQVMTKQTNILSINASIEAARAGVHGKGFMVIASEIRHLSVEANRSIEQVGQIAEQIREDMQETVNVISEAQPIFHKQFQTVNQTDVLFGHVSDQMKDFSVHLESVAASIDLLEHSQVVLVSAMDRVSGISEQTSSSAMEVADETASQIQISSSLVGLSEQLKNMSRGLKESLSYFQT